MRKVQIKQEESKLKPRFQFFEEQDEQNTNLRNLNTNIIIQKLEENIKFRDLSAKKRFEKLIKQ